MSIQQLPEDVTAQIKSSTTITSLNGVVCGLVKNSLDAGATKVTISVDYAKGNCSIEDNGDGIPPHEFTPSGGLGKLHCEFPRDIPSGLVSGWMKLTLVQIHHIFRHTPDSTAERGHFWHL
jgi:hypothetical protein